LFPALPLWAGVLITSLDVFLILFIYRPNGGMRAFEIVISTLVFVVIACFIVLLIRVEPSWPDVFRGYLPSHTVINDDAIYISVGVLGATVMPHGLILGSHISTVDRMAGSSEEEEVKRGVDHQRDQVQRHLPHASWDIALSMIFFAITVNSAILIVAAASFYYTTDGTVIADLFQAFQLLKDQVGKAPAILFAISLLAAGQSASITVTLAGQIVSEGFIEWRTNPFMRRLITRLIAMVPSLAVSAGVGKKGLDTLLVASQVGLSMALPFVIAPLLIV
ncbi:natural resistance-associated macrophage protein, partial [Violaceomyces palustris]